MIIQECGQIKYDNLVVINNNMNYQVYKIYEMLNDIITERQNSIVIDLKI